ncbi:hypothetical protein ACFQ1S_23525 [Kibdelosporangium lantanae]|uniref:Uncharacterized protein n=1 Tax=Kibdelosporangium lantanae TaxID=1497396 RepID=A0ABW3MGX0_9PSEU
MPDGDQQPAPQSPEARQAADNMQRWKQQHSDPLTSVLPFGGLISGVDSLMAAAEAGQFAVSPDTGARILQQLTNVQDQVTDMKSAGALGNVNQRLGGGYATNVAQYNQQVNNEGGHTVLGKFSDELEKLKAAVQRSMGNYGATDTRSGQNINSAGGE